MISDVSQSLTTPYGLPLALSEAAKTGQDPSSVSPKHPPVQIFPAVLQVPSAAFSSMRVAGVNGLG